MNLLDRKYDTYQYHKLLMAISVLLVFLFCGEITIQAEEYTVSDAAMVLYTTDQAGLYEEPDLQAVPVMTLEANLPMQVTGITSNGWYQVALNGVYYIPGYALTDMTSIQQPVVAPYEIPIYADQLTYRVNTIEEAQAARNEAAMKHAGTITVYSDTLTFYTIYDVFSEMMRSSVLDYGTANIHSVYVRGGAGKYTITYDYLSSVEEEVYTEAAVAMLIPYFNTGSTYDKVLQVHDYICGDVNYSYETAQGVAGFDFRSAYDALDSKVTVCSGYALLFQKFMDQMGIPCYVAAGKVNGVEHAWNLVNIDGQWYHIDCTNDDKSSGIVRDFFLRGSSYAGDTWGGITLSKTDYGK
ncbi:MAG: hypothetical protein IJ326_02740 [Lachnospiraceae bacterium]|nr:hypothetical protein [Lachnospiraceae bacterium]